MSESLQEIERLVNQCGAAIDSYIGEGSECDILMAAITRVVKEQEWQPIETAPKDGAEILVLYRGHSRYIARWVAHTEHRGRAIHGAWRSECEIFENLDLTHWMPLPEPPPARAALSTGD